MNDVLVICDVSTIAHKDIAILVGTCLRIVLPDSIESINLVGLARKCSIGGVTWDVFCIADTHCFSETACRCNSRVLIVREASESEAIAGHLSCSFYVRHISWKEVMTFRHSVETALEMTSVSVNDESILNVIVTVFLLPDCVESLTIKCINLTSLTWSHRVAAAIGYPLNDSMTVWVSKTRRSCYLRALATNKLCTIERNIAYKLNSHLVGRHAIANIWNITLRKGNVCGRWCSGWCGCWIGSRSGTCWGCSLLPNSVNSVIHVTVMVVIKCHWHFVSNSWYKVNVSYTEVGHCSRV